MIKVRVKTDGAERNDFLAKAIAEVVRTMLNCGWTGTVRVNLDEDAPEGEGHE